MINFLLSILQRPDYSSKEKYRFFRKVYQDQKFRNYVKELDEDLKLTKKEVNTWGKRENQDGTKGDFVILSFTRVPLYAKLHALMGKIALLNGYRPIILNQRGNRYISDYYHWMGIEEIVHWNHFEKKVVDEALLDSLVQPLILPKLGLQDLVNMEYEGVQIGKHALSMVCRTRLEGQLDFEDPEVQTSLKQYIRRGIKSALATKALLQKYNIKKMFVRDSGYIPNGGIFEMALVHGVDCFVHDFGQQKGSWVMKRHDQNNRNEHYFSLSDQSWKFLREEPWTQQMEDDLQNEFAERYRPDSLNDTRRLQHGKRNYTQQEVMAKLGLDPAKKTAVIFSHVAWDAAFFYGSCIFGDFERWLFETVKHIAAHGSELNWIIKLHPFNAFKLQRENKSEESEMRLLRSLFPLPPNVVIMRATTDINTQSLFPIVDYVLTVNGTVGMEFPCFGIPAILAGTGRYDNRGFTYDNHSIEEYFALLNRLHEVPPLTEEQILLAKKHYFHLMRRRQTNLEDIIPMELKRFHEAQSELHNNVSFTPRSIAALKATQSYQLLSEWFFSSDQYDVLNPYLETVAQP